jgi:hypothetical protein
MEDENEIELNLNISITDSVSRSSSSESSRDISVIKEEGYSRPASPVNPKVIIKRI